MRVALEPPSGVVSDETTFATPGLWVDGDKVRFKDGRPQVIGSWTKLHSGTITGTCRNAYQWTDLSSYVNTAIGTHNALQVLKRDTLYDITPTTLLDGNVSVAARWGYGMGGYGAGPYGGGVLMETYPRTWSFGSYGENLIANPRGRTIFLWENDTASPATALTNAPGTAAYVLVTPDRQIVALDAEPVAATYSSMVIRGCDYEDITDWSPTSTNNAFEVKLEGGSRLVAGAMLGEYMLVWSDTSLFLGQFQTDNKLDPWRFDLIASDCGLAAPNAFAITEGGAFWLTPSYRFMSYQVGGLPQPLPCPISNDFRGNLDTEQLDKVIATHIPRYNEVWWFYPDTRDGDECSRFVATNLTGEGWFKGTLERTAAAQSLGENPVWVGSDSYIYTHEDAAGDDFAWSIKTSGQYLSEGGEIARISDIWPDFEDQDGTIDVTFYTRAYSQASERDAGTWSLAPGREKRDLRVQGKIVSQKFAGSGYARFGKPTYEVRAGGRR